MNDLDWLARNVHEWPAESDARIRIDYNGEICFNPSSTEFDFYPDDIESAKQAFIPDTDCVLGKEYTYDQWQTRRAELQGKPGWDDAPDDAKALVYCPNSQSWKFEKSGNLYPVAFGWTRAYWIGDKSDGKCFGDWRNTLERRPVPQYITDDQSESLAAEARLNLKHNIEQYNQCASQVWTGPEDGLPPVGMRVVLNNKPCYDVVYMKDAIGQEVTVKATFYSGDSNMPMAAIETDDKQCGCFRVSMLEPCKTEEDKAVEEMVAISMQTPMINSLDHIETAHRDACRALYRANYRKLDTPANND